jgi:geranylgeranyl pyrophosphate synthase
VDDMLDFSGSAEALGKPALSDMEQGLATAPTLYAAEVGEGIGRGGG